MLGKVTATGKHKRAVETAVDGSKVGAAIVVSAKTIAGTTDTAVLCMVRGPASVNKSGRYMTQRMIMIPRRTCCLPILKLLAFGADFRY